LHLSSLENSKQELSRLQENYELQAILRGPSQKQKRSTDKVKPAKQQKQEHLAPIVFGRLRTSLGNNPRLKTIKILLDSGCSSTIINSSLVSKLCTKRLPTERWTTAAGQMTTNKKVKIHFNLPEFYENKIIEWEAHVLEGNQSNYDMILGRDILKELGMDINFSKETVSWEEAQVPKKPINCNKNEHFLCRMHQL
jgi:predicted aspartyl protease